MSSVQWQLGDAAPEIEPMRSYGGTNPSGSKELFTVSETIRMFAEDIGLGGWEFNGTSYAVELRWPAAEHEAPNLGVATATRTQGTRPGASCGLGSTGTST